MDLARCLFVLLPLGCGPAARPADIPPAAPDFARVGSDQDATAFGESDEDEDDDDEQGGFGGFGGSAADAAFDAATQDASPSDDVESSPDDDDASAESSAAPIETAR
jgi:hypothetical protein